MIERDPRWERVEACIRPATRWPSDDSISDYTEIFIEVPTDNRIYHSRHLVHNDDIAYIYEEVEFWGWILGKMVDDIDKLMEEEAK